MVELASWRAGRSVWPHACQALVCGVRAGIAQRPGRRLVVGTRPTDWINERRVERLIDALRLSRASGVAIENLAGDDVEKLAAPVQDATSKNKPNWRYLKRLSSSVVTVGLSAVRSNAKFCRLDIS